MGPYCPAVMYGLTTLFIWMTLWAVLSLLGGGCDPGATCLASLVLCLDADIWKLYPEIIQEESTKGMNINITDLNDINTSSSLPFKDIYQNGYYAHP